MPGKRWTDAACLERLATARARLGGLPHTFVHIGSDVRYVASAVALLRRPGEEPLVMVRYHKPRGKGMMIDWLRPVDDFLDSFEPLNP